MDNIMTNTHPLGPGTVNRTANLPAELDARLGRAVYEEGLRSRSELIRLAVERYLRESAKAAPVVALSLLLWGGAALVAGASLTGNLDQARRCVRSVRIVRVIRKQENMV